jgi:hypothetical protein
MSTALPGIPIELDRERTLIISLNALIQFKAMTGIDLVNSGKGVDFSVEQLRTFLWLALKHEDADLTEEAVGEMIRLDNLNYVTGKLAEAQGNSMPVPDPDDDEAEGDEGNAEVPSTM